jgi:hypothetical protein
MPPFDPKQYVAVNAEAKPQAFDPKAYVQKTNDEIKREFESRPTEAESALRGAAQGVSFGFADELTAGAGALVDKAQAAMGQRGDISFGDAYRTRRDVIRGRDDVAKVENPKAFTVGSVAGAVGTALTPAGAVLGPAKGGSFAGNVARSVAGGATAGAGLSNADPTSSPRGLSDFAKDVATGGAVGGAFQTGFGLVGKTANALRPSTLRSVANEKAVKAAGGMTKELRDLGPERVQELGAKLLKDKVVTAFSSLEDVAERAAAAKEDAGQAIGAALKNVDDLVVTAKQLIDEGSFGAVEGGGKEALKAQLDEAFQFNMTRIGDRIEKELIGPNANNPLLRGELTKLKGIADDFRAVGTQTMQAGNVIKGTQGKVTNFNSDTVPQAFKREVYDVIKTELDDIVAKTGSLEAGIAKAKGGTAVDAASRGQSASDAYQAAKKTYGAMARTEDMALKSAGREASNRTISLTDTIAGVAGGVSGGPLTGMALGAGNKMLRKYGDSVGAVALSKVAETLEKAPVVLGRFGPILDAAAKRGSLPSAHLELMKEPDYQRLIQSLESSAMERRLNKEQPRKEAE